MLDYARVLAHVPLMHRALDMLLHREPRHAVDDPLCDAQESALLSLVAEVDVLCAGDPRPGDVTRMANRTVRLLRTHFADEERMLSALGYPHRVEHAAEHSAILEDAEAVRREVGSRRPATATDARARSLCSFLLGVTMGHMAVADRDWARYLADEMGHDSTGCA